MPDQNRASYQRDPELHDSGWEYFVVSRLCKSVSNDVWALIEPDIVRLAEASSERDVEEEAHLVAAEVLEEREVERKEILDKILRKV